ncbi:C1 family peptidase [Chryseobacterium sp. L7]|uniref:C1 family peptidase n=1 Tax=Chryseobacterium endalhagicum TaxID=2797638 RepID=A0ABS1QG64_9FLAO|nr:C1 family peptidase [Chryseobacterium endalhagicum]MBL1221595.1 C1 family peptidase [Chryseobacterium endalhagicum]
MKNLKIISMALVMLSLASCSKNDEEIDNQQPNQEAQSIGSLGANFVDESTYSSFEKADVDALITKYKGNTSKVLPSSYFVSGQPAIGDQGNEGSCVAWATAYAATSILESNFKGVTQPRSPEYVYNQIKQGACANGSYTSDGLKLIKNQGVCSLTEMPYNDTECSTQPSVSQKNAASSHKLVSWSTVSNSNITNIKNLLSANLPIVIGITVDEEFKNLKNTGWILKKRSGKVLGGHAICVVGYDDNKQAFKIQNSWGSAWADNGYFWIDYTFFAKNQYLGGVVKEAYVAYVN